MAIAWGGAKGESQQKHTRASTIREHGTRRSIGLYLLYFGRSWSVVGGEEPLPEGSSWWQAINSDEFMGVVLSLVCRSGYSGRLSLSIRCHDREP